MHLLLPIAAAALLLLPACPERRCEDAACAAAEQGCTASGGTVGTDDCCDGATDFPSNCAIGACGCSASNSSEHLVCRCAAGKCFDGSTCVPSP